MFDLLLLIPRSAPNALPRVASASIAAFVAARTTAWHVQIREARQQSFGWTLPYEVTPSHPQVVGLWCDLEAWSIWTSVLPDLRARHPEAPLALFGPAISGLEAASALLMRLPEANLAIRGEAEASLVALLKHVASSHPPERQGLPPALAGTSWVADAGIAHGPDRPLLATETLPSPWLEASLKPSRRLQEAWLEVVRGPIPFASIPLPDQGNSPRALPAERIRQELELLLHAGVPALHIGSSPLDACPAQLRLVLNILKETPHQTAVRLELSRAPDELLAARLHEAGVAEVVLTHPSEGPSGGGPGPMLDRTRLRVLRRLGIEVTVRVHLGRPGDRLELIHARLEAYLTVPVHRICLVPERIWEGHPIRRPERILDPEDPPSGMHLREGDPIRRLERRSAADALGSKEQMPAPLQRVSPTGVPSVQMPPPTAPPTQAAEGSKSSITKGFFARSRLQERDGARVVRPPQSRQWRQPLQEGRVVAAGPPTLQTALKRCQAPLQVGGVVASTPPDCLVVRSECLTESELAELLREAPAFDRLFSAFPSTLRLLAELLDLPIMGLLAQLTQPGGAGDPDHLQGSSSPGMARRLRGFLEQSLRGVGLNDQIPVLNTMVDYEEWKGEGGPPGKPPKTIPYTLDVFDDLIPVMAPALEVRSFPRNVIEIEQRRRLGETALRQTFVIKRRMGRRRHQTYEIPPLTYSIFSAADGTHTLEELVAGLEYVPRGMQAKKSGVVDTILSLLEREQLLIVGRRNEPEEEPPPVGPRNVLPFRARR